MKLNRRDFCAISVIGMLSLAAPVTSASVKEPNAVAMMHGVVIGNIYGFDPDSDTFDKIVFSEEIDLDNDKFNILFSEFIKDEDGQSICMTSSKVNVVINSFDKKENNTIHDVKYIIDNSKRIKPILLRKTRIKYTTVSHYQVPNTQITYTL